jgi:hypothetical protein
MLDLVGHAPKPQRMLKLKETPGLARNYLVMTHAQHKFGRHQGTLYLDSPPGKGTTVIVPLPRVLP